MALPNIDNSTLYTFTLNKPVLPLSGFRSGSTDYICIQPSAWQSGENSWDNGDPSYAQGLARDPTRGYGRIYGPAAVWIQATALAITGAAVEYLDYDNIARINGSGSGSGSGEDPYVATWLRTNFGVINVVGSWRVVLQSADGSILSDITQPGLSFELPPLSANAVLWVRLENAVQQWQLPPDYLSVTGYDMVPNKYMYTEDGVDYVWDYIYDVGRRPADLSNPLYALYQTALLSGQLIHLGEWSQYISDGNTQGGLWSALRIAIDDADFSVESTFIPAPGAVMMDVAENAKQVHPCATAIMLWNKIPNGERLAGTIATSNGVAMAYWDWNSGDPTLLAVNYNIGAMVCESALYPNPDDIIQLADGTELLLTWSFLFRYAPTVSDMTKRLIGLPLDTAGHPGGRCLRSVDGVDIRYFTENFGTVGNTSDNGFIQMYNTLRTLDLTQAPTSGIGTVFHGNNCADVIWGQFWGWVQDKPFSDDTAQQFLAFLRDNDWEASSIAPFEASLQHWQRVARVANVNGQRLMCSGKEANGEGAIWAINDGTTFTEGSLLFRPRRFTPVTDETGANWLYVIGRPITLNDDGGWDVVNTWQLIKISGDFEKYCFIADGTAFKTALTDLTAAGIDVTKMPPYLSWNPANVAGGGYWLASTTQPEEPYLTLSNNGVTVAYTLTGTAPYDFSLWDLLCFPVYSDGSVGNDAIYPETGSINNAADALAAMPEGTKVLVVGRAVEGDPWSAIQVSDPNDIDADTGLRTLETVAQSYPCLWCRIDSGAAASDLSTYTQRLAFGQFQSLQDNATSRVQVCMLIPPSTGTVRAQVVESR